MTVNLKCGCKIDHDMIWFCPLHAAAPELLEALQIAADLWRETDKLLWGDDWKKIAAAIARATGEQP